jgi:GT2 family glycosyltransferase
MGEAASSGSRKGVGIVIIGRDECVRLPRCLASLAEYRGRIVYADSASTDDSVAIARKSGAFVVSVDDTLPMSPARGRNAGFAALLEPLPDCEFVQFFDGDSVPQPGWIEAGVAFLETHDKAAVVCGHCMEEDPGRSVYNWLCADEWKGEVGRIDSCGGNAMIRTAAFKQAGGFRPDLPAGEEAELAARLRARGWEIWRIDVPMVVHDADIEHFSDWWRRTSRGGYAYAHVWWLTARSPEPLYGTQLRSTIFWVVVLPILFLVAAWIVKDPRVLFVLPLAWILQTARIAAKRGLSQLDSWRYAAMIMLAKLPEALGAIHYSFHRIFARS